MPSFRQRTRPKEYVIAREVFDRPGSFDPRLDSIVRVQAAQLRARPRQYYACEGKDDPIEAEIPTCQYIPVFRDRLGPTRAQRSSPHSHESPVELSVAVLPFLDLSPERKYGYFADGLNEERTNLLSRVRSLQVLARTSAFYFKNRQEDVRTIGDRVSSPTFARPRLFPRSEATNIGSDAILG
jgi:hypothetical protein